MKTLSLAIIVGFAVVLATGNLHNVAAECANEQNGLISCSEVDFSAGINKLIYGNSERPLISVSGTPGKILSIMVLDGLGHQKISDDITIGPNGTTTYSFNASSYQLGIYRAVLADNTDKVILNFPVALQSSGPIRFHTDKDHYNAGDTITVSGSVTPSKYVQILLIDTNLLTQYKNVIHSDSAGHFVFKLPLPQFVKSGYWRIRATSESNFMILPVPVGNTEDATDLVNPPPYTYKPGLPLQQTRVGVTSGNVLCRPGLQLVQSKQDMPACVRPQTAQQLVARGWTTVVYNPANAGTVTSLSAFKLNLSTDSDMIGSGQKIGIDISFNNTSPIPLKLKSEDSRPYPGLSLGEECGFRSPIGIAILQGYYTEQNMTQGKALPIFGYIYYSVSCPAGVSSTQSYVFEPASSHAYAIPCDSGGNELPSCGGFRNEASHLKVNGTWPGGKFQPFEAGVYTIIGGDEWGHLTIKHFTVVNSTVIQTQRPSSNLSSYPCDIPYPSGSGRAVLYMPTNSTGNLCVIYSNPNTPQPVGIRIFPARVMETEAKDINTSSDHGTIPTGNTTVVYTIKTGNIAGFYGLTIFCVGMPFAVGYDANSTIVPGDFPWSGPFYCPAQFYTYHIVGLHGMGVKYIQ